MKGRTLNRRPASAAFEWADGCRLPNDSERLATSAAIGRILMDEIRWPHDVPSRRLAGCDGFALRAADTLGATDYSPLPLRRGPADDVLDPGAAAAVLCGDPLPAGADAVLALDRAEVHGAMLEVQTPLAAGDGVASAGEEGRAGEPLLPTGRRLRAQDVALLTLAGIEDVEVRRRPRVRILLAGRFARDADGPMLAGLVARDGGELLGVAVVGDEAALAAALQEPGADLLLVAGGTGFTADDGAVAAVRTCGTLEIDGVAIHPGEATALGRVGEVPVILLPGAPLACLCGYELIAARALRRLAGRAGVSPYRRRALRLARKIVSSIGRTELARVRIADDQAVPFATAEGRVLATAVVADGFVVIPEHSEGYPQGAVVDVSVFDEYD